MAATVLKHENISVSSSDDLVHLRRVVRLWTVEVGFNLVGQTKFVTATSELARNMLTFGGGGMAYLERLNSSGQEGLRLIFEDHGPGIADLNLAMKDGYSTGTGLGLGLGGAKRLVDEFEIDSHPGEGTRISITKWK